MANGDMIKELQLLLQQEKVPPDIAQRMTLSAVLGILINVDTITDRIGLMTDHITSLREMYSRQTVLLDQHTKHINAFNLNPAASLMLWSGNHSKVIIITIIILAIIVIVDIVKGGYWSVILASIDTWLKYVKLVI